MRRESIGLILVLVLAGCVRGSRPERAAASRPGELTPIPGAAQRVQALQRQEELGKAIQEGDRTSVTRMLKQHPEMLEATNQNGFTPLLLAGYYGQAEIGRLLLDAGADPQAHDPAGNNAYLAAASGGSTELLKLLLEKGADPGSRNTTGQTALHQACLMGRREMVKLLVDKGADINAVDDSGATPLHWAAAKNHLEIAQVLLAKGARADVETLAQRLRPIDEARLFKHDEMVELLKKHSADA